MSCQALDQGEVLSIRWAHDDPNPVAKDSIERADKDAMVALLRAKGISLTQASFNYPVEYQMPEPKRLRIEEGGSILEQYPQLAYPNTDEQYQQYVQSYYTANQSSSSQVETSSQAHDSEATVAAQKEALARLGIFKDQESNKEHSSSAIVENEKFKEKEQSVEEEDEDDGGEEEEEEGDGWRPYVDEATGATYYFNAKTGESSWTVPNELNKA